MRVRNMSWRKFAVIIALVASACGSSSTGGNDAGARGGSGGSAGTTGSAGSAGSAGTTSRGGTTGGAGTTGSAGASSHGGTPGGGTTGGAGTSGTQPVGAACANSMNCSQADGPAVCCVSISTCVLDGQCPGSTNYVPCTDNASCNKGGWICCNAGGMHFCTKQSGCPAP